MSDDVFHCKTSLLSALGVDIVREAMVFITCCPRATRFHPDVGRFYYHFRYATCLFGKNTSLSRCSFLFFFVILLYRLHRCYWARWSNWCPGYTWCCWTSRSDWTSWTGWKQWHPRNTRHYYLLLIRGWPNYPKPVINCSVINLIFTIVLSQDIF